MTGRDLYAGVDLGGTKILVVIASADGRVVASTRTETMASQGVEVVIARIMDALAEATRDAGVDLSDVRAIGVSAPGPVDTKQGVITDPPNLPGWHNVPLASVLHERTGVPAALENDANCGAIGEHRFGAGRGYRDMLYITVSTGIGGGIIIDDRLYEGTSGAAGEVGHIGVAADGPACGAGHPGCLEAFASGTAIANRAREEIAAGHLPLSAREAEREPPLSAHSVYNAAQRGEDGARAIIETAGRYLGIGLASVINVFNPQAIVLGGGVTHMGDMILGPAVQVARTRAFTQSFKDVRILQAGLGDRTAVLGAVAVARSCSAGNRK